MLDGLLLGAIQGLSEFLPISSSGHLALAMYFLGWEDPPLVMSLVVHLGTLAAVFAVYGRDLLKAISGGFRLLRALTRGLSEAKDLLKRDQSAALSLWIVIATIPTVIVGLLLRNTVEHATASPVIVGALLTGCGAILLASRWIPLGEGGLTWERALLIGIAQGLAVLPGLSRSGTTIIAGLALGLGRDEAARFSFVASVPAILGASILALDIEVLTSSWSEGRGYLVAAVTSLLVGYAALRLLVGLVRRGRLWWFALYMLPVGMTTILFIR